MHDITNIIITIIAIASIYFVIVMAVLARMAGGGIGGAFLAKYGFKFLPELLFALPFGFPLYFVIANFNTSAAWIVYITCVIWSYLWMQTGHGSILNWGRNPAYTKNRKQFLSPLVNNIASKLNIEIGSTNYARLFMAVKGFLIGLPVGGIVLAVLWPLAYEIGNRFKKHEVSELVSGAVAAIAIILFSFILEILLI